MIPRSWRRASISRKSSSNLAVDSFGKIIDSSAPKGKRNNRTSLVISMWYTTSYACFLVIIIYDDDCICCGEKGSIEHSLIDCTFTKLFTQKVLNWFNQVNESQISPTLELEETLFGITASFQDPKVIRKFNYTTFSYLCAIIFIQTS